MGHTGRAPYGARGLKFNLFRTSSPPFRRAPYGARGLKFIQPIQERQEHLCRAPYGARGLKCTPLPRNPAQTAGRAPYGARGLKFLVPVILMIFALVAPRMGRVD